MTEKKPGKEKQPQVHTAVLKVNIDCEGCNQKLHKALESIEGLHEFSIDASQNKVTVKGTMEPEKLVKRLGKKTGKNVQLMKEEKKTQAAQAPKKETKEEKPSKEDKETKAQHHINYPNNSGFFSEEEKSCSMM
eukprot:Gb_26201 [translate_table: standard]